MRAGEREHTLWLKRRDHLAGCANLAAGSPQSAHRCWSLLGSQ